MAVSAPPLTVRDEHIIDLSPKQAEVFDATEEELYLVGKTQSGKSFVGGVKLLADITTKPWPTVGEAFNGFAVFGATAEQARNVGGRNLALAARASNVPFVPAKSGPMLIDNRWPVFFHGIGDTHSEQALVGRTYGSSLFEEIVQCNQVALEYAETRCSVAGSQLIYTCNPNHSEHWVKKKRLDEVDGIVSRKWDFSFEDNPNIDWDYVRRLKRTLSPTQFRHLWMGEWADAEGALWTREDIEAAYILWENAPAKYERVILSIDPAITSGPDSHFTSICVLGLYKGAVYILDSWRGRWEGDQWARHARELFHRYGASYVVVEKNALGDETRSVFKAAGVELPLKLMSVSASKGTRAEPVKVLFNDRRAYIVLDPEMESKFAELEGEMVSFTGDKKTQLGPDDSVDAMVNGANYLVNKRRRFGVPR